MKNEYVRAAIATIIFSVILPLGDFFFFGKKLEPVQLIFSSFIFMAVMILVYKFTSRGD
jgi:drug/metabolite transporter (DMT)-like permease